MSLSRQSSNQLKRIAVAMHNYHDTRGKFPPAIDYGPDGTDRTLLVVEAERAIPWTKPEDIPYAPAGPLPKLGGIHTGGSYASFADGGVRWIGGSRSERDLRAICTKAGKHQTRD